MSDLNQSKSNSLKQCPFCGGELRQNMYGAWEDTNENCILYGFELRDSEKSIEAWNRREPIDKVVEQLEEEMERSRDLCDWGARFKAFRDAIEIVREGGVDAK